MRFNCSFFYVYDSIIAHIAKSRLGLPRYGMIAIRYVLRYGYCDTRYVLLYCKLFPFFGISHNLQEKLSIDSSVTEKIGFLSYHLPLSPFSPTPFSFLRPLFLSSFHILPLLTSSLTTPPLTPFNSS